MEKWQFVQLEGWKENESIIAICEYGSWNGFAVPWVEKRTLQEINQYQINNGSKPLFEITGNKVIYIPEGIEIKPETYRIEQKRPLLYNIGLGLCWHKVHAELL